ncbi:4'-phosphopantetheinyl transferase family protein [Moraxella pluranimalium]|nr:4'-phosphopantetheinyl transferase superfamily protein [Moraxella pluranimalium]
MSLIHPPWIYQSQSTIIAYAQMTTADKSLQSPAVRELLYLVLSRLGKQSVLSDDNFPYRLMADAQTQEFVSFSHSRDCVALIISPYPCGVDVEIRPISQAVAKRFFSYHENLYLQNYPTDTQAIYRQILWQLKESWIKLNGGTLTQGMGVDFGQYLVHIHPQNDSTIPLHDGYMAYINPSLYLSAIYQS